MKKLLQKIRGWSIVWQITILFTAIMVIPTTMVARAYYSSFEQSLLEQASFMLREDLLYMQSSTRRQVASADALLDQLAFNQEFPYFLDEANHLSEREIETFMSAMQAELIGIRYIYPNRFSMVAYFASNSQLRANHVWGFTMEELAQTSYYEEIATHPQDGFVGRARKREVDVVLPQMGSPADNNELVLPFYQKVFNLSTGEWIGTVELNIPLFKLLDDPRFQETDQGQVYMLFDQQGTLLYQEGKGGYPCELAIQAEKGEYTLDISGSRYMVSYAKDPSTGLVSAVSIPYDSLFESTQNMKTVLVLISVGACFAILGITYIFMRVLFRRLREMDQKMEQIKDGNFDVHIEENGFLELSRIARSFNRMAGRLDTVMQQQIAEEKAKRQAEMRALQAQINPHFLYNTLENMRMQCEVDEYYPMAESLENLGDLLKYSIHWSGETATLRQEWDTLRNYIAIMRMRFEDNLLCELSCEEGLMDVQVPKFILQPMLENSFNYGFEAMLPPWKIKVDIRRQGGCLVASIQDNGAGIPPARLEEIRRCLAAGESIPNTNRRRRSIGLSNVSKRIALLCPAGSSLAVTSIQGEGTTVTIRIVLEEKGQQDEKGVQNFGG